MTNAQRITNAQCPIPYAEAIVYSICRIGHWSLVILWSLGIGYWAFGRAFLLLSNGKPSISGAPREAQRHPPFLCPRMEATVYVACSTLSFARFPLDQALRMIAELEFSKVDIAIHERGSHLRPSEVAEDLGLASQRIRIGPSLSPAAFSVEIEAADEETYRNQLRAICHLARLSTVSVMTLAAASAGSGLDAEIKRLTSLVHLAEIEGVGLTVETRIGTLTENPETAVELCKRVPGLGLTL